MTGGGPPAVRSRELIHVDPAQVRSPMMPPPPSRMVAYTESDPLVFPSTHTQGPRQRYNLVCVSSLELVFELNSRGFNISMF